jgi:septal ring factor EnvC (AmiA/AmiB activator)
MTLLLLGLLAGSPATTPAVSATVFPAVPAFAQIEKQALEIQRLAQAIQDLAETSRVQGRPQGLAALESDVAVLIRHLNRLRTAIAELEQSGHSASP